MRYLRKKYKAQRRTFVRIGGVYVSKGMYTFDGEKVKVVGAYSDLLFKAVRLKDATGYQWSFLKHELIKAKK